MYRPLTKKQKAMLSQLAREAYNQQSEYGLADVPGDTESKRFANWRHKEQVEAVGKPSLTKCNQDDFLPLRAHFNSILGRDDKAFTDTLQHQPANDHADPNDTPEHRKQKLHLIKETLEGTKFHINYAVKVSIDKFSEPKLENLTVKQLTQLLYTLTNRINKAKQS